MATEQKTAVTRTSPARTNPARRVAPKGPAQREMDRRYAYIRLGLVIAIVVYTVLVVHATAARDVPFQKIEAAMAAEPALNGLNRLDENAFTERFGIGGDGLEGWLLYGGDTVMEVSELLIAKSPDAAALDRLEEAARGRLDGQKEAFRNYGTNQIDLLEHAILWRRGSYLFYGVSASVDRLEARFVGCIG